MKFLREWAHAPPFESSAARPAALLPWITDYNATVRTLRQQIATEIAALIASAAITPPDTSDAESCFGGTDGVKPRAATAAGGWGLSPPVTPQAQSDIGWDNLLATTGSESTGTCVLGFSLLGG